MSEECNCQAELIDSDPERHKIWDAFFQGRIIKIASPFPLPSPLSEKKFLATKLGEVLFINFEKEKVKILFCPFHVAMIKMVASQFKENPDLEIPVEINLSLSTLADVDRKGKYI